MQTAARSRTARSQTVDLTHQELSVTDCSMTRRSSKSRAQPALSPLEGECMSLFWNLGPMTSEEVRTALPKALRESTVRTLLRRITEKGYLTHDIDGRTFVYRPTEPPATVAASGVRHLADLLYRGSVGDLLVGLVENDEIDPVELDVLMARIHAARTPADGDGST